MIESQVVSLASRCILDTTFKPFQSSVIACAILFQVRRDCGIEPVWRSELTSLTFHDPYTNKYVRRVLVLLDAFREEVPESTSRSSDVSVDEDFLAATAAMSCMSPKPREAVSASDMCTPDQNKENNKPLDAELSPVSIANLVLA